MKISKECIEYISKNRITNTDYHYLDDQLSNTMKEWYFNKEENHIFTPLEKHQLVKVTKYDTPVWGTVASIDEDGDPIVLVGENLISCYKEDVTLVPFIKADGTFEK